MSIAAALAPDGAWSASATDQAPAQETTVAPSASFKRSGMRTATYEIGNTLNNFVFLSAGVGGIAGGALLTAFNTLQSWTIYTTNDYIWEKLYPPEAKTGDAFDPKQSVWRTTLKYMTGKPVVASVKIAAIYVFTGSAAVAVGYGLAATTGASVVFYTNNLAWDYYEQSIAPWLWPAQPETAPLTTAAAD